MAYVHPNYLTKREFLDAVKAGKEHQTYNPSGMFPATQNGRDTVEGPHYPRPHKWYSEVIVEQGIVKSAK